MAYIDKGTQMFAAAAAAVMSEAKEKPTMFSGSIQFDSRSIQLIRLALFLIYINEANLL